MNEAPIIIVHINFYDECTNYVYGPVSEGEEDIPLE